MDLRRTDLAMEARELWQERAGQAAELPGVQAEERERAGMPVTVVRVLDEAGERALGKPRGTYITLTLEGGETRADGAFPRAVEAVAAELGALLEQVDLDRGPVLVAGLGNRAITPDALGPESADMVLATRHIGGEFARSVGLDDLRPTAVLTPGVLGQTGTESGEIVRGVCTVVHPVAVVVVDALAARSVARLGCTVQLCDTGIAPGSGVGNNRQPLNAETLGVPVIGMGVPTVVDAATIAREFSDRGEEAPDLTPRGAQMMVTPREVDVMIHRAARLVAMAINGALQPDYNPLELIAVAKG